MSLPSATNVVRPRAKGYHARIDDLLLRLSVSPDRPLDIITAPLQAPAINTAQNAEDLLNEFGQVFSRVDFTGGAGLDKAHVPNLTELDRTRFWDSTHIDVTNPRPGQPSKLVLLPPTANVETSTSSNLHLAYDGTAVMMAEGSVLRRSTDPTATTPTFGDDDPDGAGTQDVSDLTTLGALTYAACGSDGLQKKDGTWSELSSTHTVRVWGIKRRLFAATGTGGNVLDVVATAGTHTTIATLAAGQQWRDGCDAGQAVLFCADDGAIYAFGFPSGATIEGAALELKAQTSVGRGEVPYAIEWDGTFVFYATREVTPSGAIGRLYRAELTDGFTLAGAQLLRQWGEQDATLDHCPRAIRATRNAVFIGVLEADGSFLWRYDRASGGLTRHLDLGATGVVVDVLAVAGRLFATVAGHGLRREAVGSFEASGYIIGPLADFFTAAQKSWAGARLEHDPIESDSRVELYYTTDVDALVDPDSTSWTRVKNVSTGQDTSETAMAGVEARYLAGMVKLYANTDADVSPAVRSYSFRAYPGDGDVEVTLNVVISDTIERPGYKRQRVRGLGDRVYNALKGKEGSYAELEIYRPDELLRGLVEQVGTRVPTIVTKGAVADVAAVKFRGRRVSLAGVSESDGSLGVGSMGVMFMGGQEEAA